MIKAFVIFLFILCSVSVFSHRESPVKIIIDTDMGLDDIRAMALLLQSDHVDIQAIIASEGVVEADSAVKYINKMLAFFDKTGIPVYKGHELNNTAPLWRKKVTDLQWDKYPQSENKAQSLHNLKLSGNSSETYIYAALGPLTNLSILLNYQNNFRDRIASVYFAGNYRLADKESQDTNSLNGFNINYDSASAFRVFNSQIPIYCFNLTKKQLPVFNCEILFNDIEKKTVAEIFLAEIFDKPEIKEHLCGQHPYHAYDDVVALYLDEPYIGSFEMYKGDYNTYRVRDWNIVESADLYKEILSGEESAPEERETVVLNDYPYDPELFRDDVKPLVDGIIERHGKEEWKSVLLTNELHRHLGIYSIIGAKMGIRAREILNADLDDVKVESFAGNEPPLSCLNDGLQVATGASLGRGNIFIMVDEILPKSHFVKDDKMLVMSVKQSIVNKITNDVKNAGKKYGLQSKEYFEEIRRLSFEYWLELDRNYIFEEFIERLDKGKE